MFNIWKVQIIPLLKVSGEYSAIGEESNSEMFMRDYVLGTFFPLKKIPV